MSVNLIANDMVTSGFRPQYFIVDLNLPPEIPEDLLKQYWLSLSAECSRMGIAIVGGHTGRFDGCNYTIIGSGVMLSTGSSRAYLSSRGGREGDKVIMTKTAANSATGLLAKIFPNKVRERLTEDGLQSAVSCFRRIPAWNDALIAVSVGIKSGGVSAIHDVTEGGVLSALCELALASGLGLAVDRENIPVLEETRAICELFEMDPYRSLGEGSLVMSCLLGFQVAEVARRAWKGRSQGLRNRGVDRHPVRNFRLN